MLDGKRYAGVFRTLSATGHAPDSTCQTVSMEQDSGLCWQIVVYTSAGIEVDEHLLTGL
jgi:hypothetical protein